MDRSSLAFVGAFESTYQPMLDVDVLESTEHVARRRGDFALLSSLGITSVRYPIRWHRIEVEPGRYDWRDADDAFAALSEHGLDPIVDLVHHTSYPRWLADGFADRELRRSYVRFCEAFVRRYPHVGAYTLFNEPLATLMLAGHEGLWPPYHAGMGNFVAMLTNVVPAISEAAALVRDALPDARHVWVDTCERHGASEPGWPTEHAAMANERRFFILDALLGRADDTTAFARDVIARGGASLFSLEPVVVDELGLDYYAHNEWWYAGDRGFTPSPQPHGLAAIAAEYGERYQLPLVLTETNIRGRPSDRATWLKYTLEQCELLQAAGFDVRGYCWFPTVDSCDWNSLLSRCDRSIDPVGVWSLDEQFERHASVMTDAYMRAARGASAAELPAYRFAPPVDRWLRGFAPQCSHWDWIEAPADDGRIFAGDDPDTELELRIR